MGKFLGERYILIPLYLYRVEQRWQQALIYNLYELKPDGQRRYREALVGVPKGNGKSQLAAALGLYELLGAGTTSPLVTVAAATVVVVVEAVVKTLPLLVVQELQIKDMLVDTILMLGDLKLVAAVEELVKLGILLMKVLTLDMVKLDLVVMELR